MSDFIKILCTLPIILLLGCSREGIQKDQLSVELSNIPHVSLKKSLSNQSSFFIAGGKGTPIRNFEVDNKSIAHVLLNMSAETKFIVGENYLPKGGYDVHYDDDALPAEESVVWMHIQQCFEDAFNLNISIRESEFHSFSLNFPSPDKLSANFRESTSQSAKVDYSSTSTSSGYRFSENQLSEFIDWIEWKLEKPIKVNIPKEHAEFYNTGLFDIEIKVQNRGRIGSDDMMHGLEELGIETKKCEVVALALDISKPD